MKHSKFVAVIFISAALLCGSCNSVFCRTKPDSTTAILGAFPEEVVMLTEQLIDKEERIIEGMKFVRGELKGRRVVVAFTGIAKVNTAMTTILLIEHFRPSEVIFTGVAGGINPDLFPGDIVIAEKTAQHDLGTLTPAGLEIGGAPNPITGRQNPAFLPADERLLKLAQRAAAHAELKATMTGIGQRAPRILIGVIVTGDIFAASTDKSTELRNRLGADAVEMEGAAVAQICYQRQVPCIVIRGISDRAGDNALEDLHKFQEIAARNSARLVSKMAEFLGSELSIQESVGKN